MSGLARILRGRGARVTGSDIEASPITEKLAAEGFPISLGEAAENLPTDTDFVVHTTAADPRKNLELRAAAARGIKISSYPEMLGRITADKKLVAIAGTHGKTTTTGLLVAAGQNCGVDFSVLVGTNLPELDNVNACAGSGDVFVCEACEYRRAFLNLSPQVLIVTNCEAEHLDYFRDEADYISAFVAFVKKLPSDGTLIADSREKNLAPLIAAAPNFSDTAKFKRLSLKIPGEHNQKNAALALAAAHILKWDESAARIGVEKFAGGERRFELRGEFRGAPIIDDYAHHPTEISALLAATREKFPTRRVVLVYQQHQLDRARKFLPEIAVSLAAADVVVIPNLYRVRTDSGSEISGSDFAAAVRAENPQTFFTENFARTVVWLRENIQKNDVVLVVGAGDVFKISEELLA